MELWDVLDKEGNSKGRTIVRGQPLQPGDYHLVAHAWIVDSNARFLIQKRADDLELHPGIWATAGGSALTGEDSETAMIRELHEELGISVAHGEMKKLRRIVRSDNILDIWLLERDINLDKLTLQEEEVTAVQKADKTSLLKMIPAGSFYDYGAEYFEIVFGAVD